MRRRRDFPVIPSWLMVMRDAGLDPAEVLARAKLPANLFTARDSMTTEECLRLWEGMEQSYSSGAFPIAMVEAVTAETFLPPIFAAMCSPNLSVAAARIQQYNRILTPQTLEIESDGQLSLRYEWIEPVASVPVTFNIAQLLLLLKMARTATRERIVPHSFILPKEPPHRNLYEDYVGTRISIGDKAAIIFSAADASKPFLTSNTRLWATFEPDLRKKLEELTSDATVADRVHSVLLELLPSGRASLEEVSKKLAISKRTLQRRLKEQNTSFQEVVNNTRESLARHYLKSTNLSGAEIAFLLGFEDPNSFFRAFNDWTGTTPERLRKQLATAA